MIARVARQDKYSKTAENRTLSETLGNSVGLSISTVVGRSRNEVRRLLFVVDDLEEP